MARVLILGHETLLLKRTARWLAGSGHSILWCPSRTFALVHLYQASDDLQLLMMELTGRDTSELSSALVLKAAFANLKVMLISPYTATSSNSQICDSLDAGARDSVQVLETPFTGLELLRKIDFLIGEQPSVRACRTAGFS